MNFSAYLSQFTGFFRSTHHGPSLDPSNDQGDSSDAAGTSGVSSGSSLGQFPLSIHADLTPHSLNMDLAPVAAQSPTTSGFTIIPTWAKSVLDLGSVARADFEEAAETAIRKIEAVITTKETIHIDFGFGIMPYDNSSAGVGGAESVGNSAAYSWTEVYKAVEAIENSASASAVQKAAAALLIKDNAKYGGVLNDDMMDITRAEALALGLPTSRLTTGQNGFDGWVALGTGAWDWNQSSTSAEDAVSGLEHEISEVMGRVDDLGVSNGNQGEYTLLDMFHYGSANPSTVGGAAPGSAAGALDEPFVAGYNPHDVSYFSYDGKTVTWQYDTPVEVNSYGEDVADWSTTNTARTATSDSFDGAGGNAIDPALSVADWEEMNVLGYTETTRIPLDDFSGNGKSDLLIQNTAGVVDVAEIAASGKESLTKVKTLGAQWTIQTTGNFLDDFTSDYLIQNSGDDLQVAAVAGTVTRLTNLGVLNPNWSFVGSGDFLGLGYDQFLIENNVTGVVDLGQVSGGKVAYARVSTPAGSPATDWSIFGTGDFTADGKADFLIQNNTTGALELGAISNNQLTYTSVGALGSTWLFAGAGDFLGEGHDQFLLQAKTGALEIGDVAGGKLQLTTLATPTGSAASQWFAIGTGQYLGGSNVGFMLENAVSGALELGAIANNHLTYTNVGSLGAAWTSVG